MTRLRMRASGACVTPMASTPPPTSTAAAGNGSAASARIDRAALAWLWSVAALIACIVLVGGATRLTESGLSITEWRPVSGVLPPLNEQAWQEAFSLYQASPQYQLDNPHFGLEEFQRIFWWEWAHRLLGRVIGLVVLVPLLVPSFRRRLAPWLRVRAYGVVALIGFQGALGWFMVASGLVDVPRVSHFRLSAHLLTALFALCFVIWTALDASRGRRKVRGPMSRPIAVLTALLVVQIAWGAFVAGLDAGLYYPTWPRMGGRWVPPGFGAGGIVSAVINDPVTVQWVHRWLGAALLVVGLTVSTRAIGVARLRRSALAVAVLLCGQFALGVATLLNFYLRPVLYGVTHQAGAVALLCACVLLLHDASVPRRAP